MDSINFMLSYTKKKNQIWSPLYRFDIPSISTLLCPPSVSPPLYWMIPTILKVCSDLSSLYTGYCTFPHNPYWKTSQEKLSGFSFPSPHPPPQHTHIPQFILQHTLIWLFLPRLATTVSDTNTDGHVSIFILWNRSTSLHIFEDLLLLEALNWFLRDHACLIFLPCHLWFLLFLLLWPSLSWRFWEFSPEFHSLVSHFFAFKSHSMICILISLSEP